MIRKATIADIPCLVALGISFMRESQYSTHLTINRQAQAKLALMLIRVNHGLLLVDDRNGEIVGMIGVLATLHPHSDDAVMSELFWYVKPSHRGSGVRLLMAAEKWARAHGIRKSIVVSPSTAVSNFYLRMGYERLEEQFIKDLDT